MASPQTVNNYLSMRKMVANKELAAEWTTLENLYNEKLWNEITLKLMKLVNHESLQNEEALMELYHNFISSFESKINPYGLVEILAVVSDHISNKTDAVQFLEKLKEKVKVCDEAVWFIKVLQGNAYLNHLQNLEQTKAIIDELKQCLEEAGSVTPVHSKYYNLASQYYRRVGQHAEYYRCGLQFLGCSTGDEYTKEEMCQQALYLGLAALLGEGIYNIGELLASPILESLQGTENEWLIELLKAFNAGDINKFNSMKPVWSKIPDLVVHEIALRQKISLLCLMEMAFTLPANQRCISFEDIAKKAVLPIKEVELLVMKGLSQDLVRGHIDQVAGVVNVTWVKPRVLDLKQVTSVASNLDVWMESITSMEKLMEVRACEILTN